MWVQLVTIPLVGALIGWITNVLAIKLIFRPYRPVVIPLVNYRLQGLIPKRREQLAANVGQVIGNELLPLDDVMVKLKEKHTQKKIVKLMVDSVGQRLDEGLPALVPLPLKKLFLHVTGEILSKETPYMINKFFGDWSRTMKEEVDFSRMIEEKINAFDLRDLERVILLIASRELRDIEILGGVLGFLIGAVQALFFCFSR